MPWFKYSFVILSFYPTALIPKYHPKTDTLLFLCFLPLLRLLTVKTSGKLQNVSKFYYRAFCELLDSCNIPCISETDQTKTEQIKKALNAETKYILNCLFITEL